LCGEHMCVCACVCEPVLNTGPFRADQIVN
jgi:hypothetical protein